MAYDAMNAQTPRAVFIGSGTRGPFSFQDTSGNAIRIRTQSHLVVRRYTSVTDETGTLLALNTDYTVNNTDVDVVTITLTSAQAVLSSTERLLVERLQSVADVLTLTQGGNFSGPAIAAAMSIFAEELQEARRDIDRAIKTDWRETTERKLPIAPTSAAKFLIRNTDGSVGQVSGDPAIGTLGDITDLAASWNTLLSSASTKALALLDGIKKFATYAALIASTTDTGLIDKGLYIAEARAAADDGGYGMFQWREGDSTTPDGGTVLAHATLPGGAGGGRFIRLHVGSWVDIRWFPGGGTGSDCSAALAAAMGTGKHVYLPRLSARWVVGSGTALPAFVSRQWLITDNVQGAVTQITFSVSLPLGALATRADDSGIGAGFSIIPPTDRALIDGIYFRTFTIGDGLVAGAHQVVKMGNASAAGGSYRFYNHADVSQRYGRIVVTGASGTFTAGRVVTGGTSGATGTIEAWESGTGTLTLSSTSATAFSAAETITEATSGYTATVSTVYRPDHIFKAINFLGDFISDATVEGAFDGASDGFHGDSNTASRVDEMHISKYFARCRRAVSFEDARGVNLHFTGDFEGCGQASFYFVVTSSTAKGVGYVGWSQVYIKAEKAHVNSGGTAGVVMNCARAGVEFEGVDINIAMPDAQRVTGVQIDFSQSTFRGCKIRLSGMILPVGGTAYGVQIVEGASASIIGLDVEVDIDQQGGATALAALVHITGTPEGRIGSLVGSGTITARLVMNVTPSKNLRIQDSESGVPIGASALYGPDFVGVNITVAAADFDMVRGGAGGVLIWRPEMDIRIIGSDWEFSTAPTANHIDVKIDVAGVNVKAHTNTGVVTQSESYWASGDIVVTKGEAVEMYVRPDATYDTANADVIGRIKYVPLWNDA